MTKALTKAENVATIRDLLEKNKDKIQQALPPGMEIVRYMRIISNAINQTPKLQLATARSVIMSVLEASQLGLELNSQLGHAYLIPWKDKRGGYYASYIIGYKGILKLVYNSGKVSSVRAVPIYKWDEHDYQEGSEVKIIHSPKEPPHIPKEEDLLAVYSVANIAGRDKDFCFMWKVEVDGIRARSKAKSHGPWVTDYIPMALKTVIRKHSKTLPMSPEDQVVIQREEGRELGYYHPMDVSDVPIIEASDNALDGPEEPAEGEAPDEEPKTSTDDLRKRLEKANGTAPEKEAPEKEAPEKTAGDYVAPGVMATPEGNIYAPDKWPKDLPPLNYTDKDGNRATFREFALSWKKERLVEWETHYRHLILNEYGPVFPIEHQAGFATLWQQKCKENYFVKNGEKKDDRKERDPGGQATTAGSETPPNAKDKEKAEAPRSTPEDSAAEDVLAADFQVYKVELEPAEIASMLEAFGVNEFDELGIEDKRALLKNCSEMLDAKSVTE